MKIKQIICRPGIGAWYVTDLEAIRRGALPDAVGFLYEGEPVSPGFAAIRTPARTVALQMVLEDGQVALGDCVTTIYPGRPGRDNPLTPEDLISLLDSQVSAMFVGRSVERFRPNDDFLAEIRIDGKPLSPSARYGLSQALLDAAAKARHVPMARILADEWGTEITSEYIPINLQTGPDSERGMDKIILRRGEIFHTKNPHNEKMFEVVPDFLRYLRSRLERLAPTDYHPRIHLDFYGLMGKIFGGDVGRIVGYILELEDLAGPYGLIIGDVVEMPTRDAQIEKMGLIRQAARAAGVRSKLLVEEHCLTLEDHRAFVDGGAADYQKIRPLDLGNISEMMNIARHVKKERAETGVGLYLTGSGSEPEQAARVRTHVALASGVDFMIGSPGMGVDEAHTLIRNEMTRTFALIQDLGV